MITIFMITIFNIKINKPIILFPNGSMGQVRLEGTIVGHLVQPSCSSHIIQEHVAQGCVQIVPEHLQ